jgi:hypothetical protein
MRQRPQAFEPHTDLQERHASGRGCEDSIQDIFKSRIDGEGAGGRGKGVESLEAEIEATLPAQNGSSASL